MANTVSARRVRQVVQKQGLALESFAPALRELAGYAKATRAKVDMFEAFRDMTLWQRLRWLLRGYRG